MPIITLRDGTRINSDHVLQFQKFPRSTRFLLSDGTVVTGEPYGDLDEQFIPTFPANPGFRAVYAHLKKDGTYRYTEQAVIAWTRAPAGNYPVFQGYEGSDQTDYAAIVEPTGFVYDSDGNQYDSLDAWKAEYEAENPPPGREIAA